MGLLTNPDEYYMQMAMAEAQAAYDEDEIPVGAVIVSHDTILARTHNHTEQLGDATAHAEMLAYTAAAERVGAKYLADCTLYVTLEPCVMCAGAAAWCQVGRIVYGASDPKRGFMQHGIALLHPKTTVTSGILAQESEALLKKFFKEKRQ